MEHTNKVVKFYEYCEVILGKYPVGGRNYIELVTVDIGIPMCTASVNLVDTHQEEDEVAIKDYSENTGVEKALRDAGIISEPVRTVPCGLTTVHICKILVPNN